MQKNGHSPSCAEVEVHHVAESVPVEHGVDCVQGDGEEGHGERQSQLKEHFFGMIVLFFRNKFVFYLSK